MPVLKNKCDLFFNTLYPTAVFYCFKNEVWVPQTRQELLQGTKIENCVAEKVVPHWFEQRTFFGDCINLVQHPR